MHTPACPATLAAFLNHEGCPILMQYVPWKASQFSLCSRYIGRVAAIFAYRNKNIIFISLDVSAILRIERRGKQSVSYLYYLHVARVIMIVCTCTIHI